MSTRELTVRVEVFDTNTKEVLGRVNMRVNERPGAVIRPQALLRKADEATDHVMEMPRVREQLTPWVKGEKIPHRKGATS
jgi:hypothetical protein